MQDKIRALLVKHCIWIEDSIEKINDNLIAILRDPVAHPEAASDVRNLVHQIKGSSGTMGFKDLSEMAGLFDQQLKSLDANAGGTSSDHEAALVTFSALKILAAETSPQGSSLFNANLG